MKNMIKISLIITAIGVAVKVGKKDSKKNQSVFIHAVNKHDAIEGMKIFLNKEKKEYLTHEYDEKKQYIYLLVK